jgi:hypothetical protein
VTDFSTGREVVKQGAHAVVTFRTRANSIGIISVFSIAEQRDAERGANPRETAVATRDVVT